jgi:hypothetical protein
MALCVDEQCMTLGNSHKDGTSGGVAAVDGRKDAAKSTNIERSLVSIHFGYCLT